MAGFTKDIFRRGLSWLGSQLGLVKNFAPAVSHDAEVAAGTKAKEVIQKAAKPTTAATPALPTLANNAEAYGAAQTIKEMAGNLKADPSRVNEVIRQSLHVFDSPAAAHYVGDVTRTLASTMPQVGPQAGASLMRAVKEGHRALEGQIVKRVKSGLQPGADKARTYSDNLHDAATLLETGATGQSRDFALKVAVRNLDDLEREASGAGVGALAKLAKTPQMMRELEESAFRNGGNRQVFSADSVLAAAKANGANAGKNAEWRDTLTRTLDHQFTGNPRAELEWLAQHKGDVIGQIPANVLVHRALAAAQQLPPNATSPAHDAVIDMAKGVKLTPELDKQVAKFWLDSNIALRQAGHGTQAEQSAMKAVSAMPHTSQVGRVAETEFKVGHIATPRPATPQPPPPAATETVSLPDSWSAAGNKPGQTMFNFKPFETAQAAKQGTQAAASDPRASLLTDNLHNTPVRSPRPD